MVHNYCYYCSYCCHRRSDGAQIGARSAGRALEHVLGRLVELEILANVPPEASGKMQPMWVVRNSYAKGTPFPRAPAAPRAPRAVAEVEEEEPEELADIEIERQKNIARNQEILRSLGLA